MAKDGVTEKKFNIPFWLSKMTLDIIGKSMFKAFAVTTRILFYF
jgi:hypothetical protein